MVVAMTSSLSASASPSSSSAHCSVRASSWPPRWAWRSRISFQRGFLGYLNELETQRLGVLTATLAEVYRDRIAAGAAHGDAWAFLRGEEDEWRRIVRASDRSLRASRDAEGRPDGAPGDRTRRAGAAPRRRAAVAGCAGVRRRRRRAGLPAAPQPRAGSRQPRRAVAPHHAARCASAGWSPAIRGPPPMRCSGRSSSTASTVGWVASVPFRELTNAADLSFQQRQSAAAWYIAGLAVLLAGLTAWALGRVFLAPAQRLAAAIHQLAAGRFDTRVSVTSSDELGRLAADFNRLANTLERNENLRRDFMADVSHELRTPLAIMRGELEAMEDGLQPLDSRSIQSLQSEVAVLSKLVDDIHQLSIADVGSLSYRRVPFDVAGVLEQGVDAFRDRLQARGIVPRAAGAGGAAAGGRRPGAAAAGLSQHPGECRPLCGPGCAAADRMPAPRRRGRDRASTIPVPGVPDENLGKLFDRFYRVEGSRNRATGGSGLGLSICQSIVAAHDGSLAASRSPLGGLALTLRLPAAAATGERKA